MSTVLISNNCVSEWSACKGSFHNLKYCSEWRKNEWTGIQSAVRPPPLFFFGKTLVQSCPYTLASLCMLDFKGVVYKQCVSEIW